jgi:response regulator of citrate/malate metabolism
MKEIVIIEPDSAINILLTKVFKDYDTKSYISSSLAKNHDFKNTDIVITEIFFNEGITGWEIMDTLNKNFPNIKIFVLTSAYNDDIIDRIFSYKIKDYIKKPFSITELKHRVMLN